MYVQPERSCRCRNTSLGRSEDAPMCRMAHDLGLLERKHGKHVVQCFELRSVHQLARGAVQQCFSATFCCTVGLQHGKQEPEEPARAQLHDELISVRATTCASSFTPLNSGASQGGKIMRACAALLVWIFFLGQVPAEPQVCGQDSRSSLAMS